MPFNFQLDWLSSDGVGAHPLILIASLILVWLYKKLCRLSSRVPNIPTGLITGSIVLFLIQHFTSRLHNDSLDRTLDVIATLALCLGILRAVVYFIIDYLLQQRRHVTIPAITSDVVLGVLWFLTIMVVLRQKLDIDLASLITTSAVLTAVIGFALQDTLGNLFAGLAIQAEQPYQIGDWVQIGDYTGQVEGISWRSTKVMTTKRETVYVPNSSISKGAIFNYSQPTSEYVASFEIGVSYDAPPNRVKSALMKTLMHHPQIMRDRPQEVRLLSFSESSITYQMRFWVNSYAMEYKIKSDLLNHIWYQFRRENLNIPYPVRQIIQTPPKTATTPLNRIEELLENVDLFDPLSDDDRKKLASRVKTELFGAQEEVCRQDMAGDCLYIIVYGSGRVLVTYPGDAVSHPVAVLKSGDIFGEMSLLTGANRNATVIAEEDMECIVIGKNDVKDILLAKPEVAEQLSRVLAQRKKALDALAQKGASKEEDSGVAAQILMKIWDFLKT